MAIAIVHSQYLDNKDRTILKGFLWKHEHLSQIFFLDHIEDIPLFAKDQNPKELAACFLSGYLPAHLPTEWDLRPGLSLGFQWTDQRENGFYGSWESEFKIQDTRPSHWVDGFIFAGMGTVPFELLSTWTPGLSEFFWERSFLDLCLHSSYEVKPSILGGPFWDFSTPASLGPCLDWDQKTPQPYGLFDRDGVVIIDNGYPHRIPDDLKLIPEALKVMKTAQIKGYKLAILTNQAGLAKGKLTHHDYQEFTQALKEALLKEDIRIHSWLYCPYHEEGIVPEWTKKSFLRKPHPGMLLKLILKEPIDLERSFMIGDKPTDKLGLKPKTFFLSGQYPYPKGYQTSSWDQIENSI